MNRHHFISNSTLPNHIKAKIRARMRGTARDHGWRVYYRPDDVVFCNPTTTVGRKKIEQLNGDGWSEIGVFTETSPLVENLEWIRSEVGVV